MVAPPPIQLLLSDVDGTLVTRDKVLTPRAVAAVRALHTRGIHFSLVSARPARGMAMFVAPLALISPFAAFNGGLYVQPDLSIIEEHALPLDAARDSLALLDKNKIEAWLFSGNDWLLRDPKGAHVDHEIHTVDFQPTIVTNFDDAMARADKIVGVSDDYDLLARCEREAQQTLGARANALRSQSYYLDFTHKDANKGAVVDYLSRLLSIPAAAIATIGDGLNDIAMFRRSGFSIAMGNGSDDVRSAASVVTSSSEEEGFAQAVERYLLGAEL
jgi:Cof subfamily protein (haloacid dehalogenase superfamily)